MPSKIPPVTSRGKCWPTYTREIHTNAPSIVNVTDRRIRLFVLKSVSMIGGPAATIIHVRKDMSDHVLQVRRVAYLGIYRVFS